MEAENRRLSAEPLHHYLVVNLFYSEACIHMNIEFPPCGPQCTSVCAHPHIHTYAHTFSKTYFACGNLIIKCLENKK